MPKIPPGSVEVGPAARPGEGRARRCYASPNALVESPAPNVNVIADILVNSVEQFPNKNALGWRDLVRTIDEVKTVNGVDKTWTYFELSDYKYWSYAEFAAIVRKVGSALVATGHNKDTIFNIYSGTSPRWQVMANACASQSITFATAYDSLGEEGLEHSINEPSVYGLFTNANLLGTVAAVIGKTPSVQIIVYDGPQAEVKKGAIEAIKAANPAIKIYTFEQYVELGEKKPSAPNHPQPEDIACIMYTSGSTGAPKGVLLTNGNIVSSIAAVKLLIGDVLTPEDHYIAYLPLAHIFEFVVELCMFYVGIPMGFGTVKTLTDTSVRNCVGDIRAFRPTIMVGVPAVWELIRKGILVKVKAGGSLKSSIFNGALSMKKAGGPGSTLAAIADAVVFKQVQQGTGGRLKLALSGGAPISRETQEFLTNALVMVVQGYGMTESCAMCAILPPSMHRYGAVGVPVPSCEIKLVDCPEANYFSSNTVPQGEILIRGPSVTKGYYKRDEVTKETITEDGWLKTGDIGQWNKDGTLSIIDRLKNLVKLAGGEYIALERLESVYKACGYVSNICLIADSSANRAIAIIFPHEINFKALATEKGMNTNVDLKTLCASSELKELVLREINAVGKKAGLKPLEALCTIILTGEEWTPQNGLLTAAQKLQRKTIQTRFAQEIKAVYP